MKTLAPFLFEHKPQTSATDEQLRELFWQNNIHAFSQIRQMPGSNESYLPSGWARFFTGRNTWIFNSLFPLHPEAQISEDYIAELVSDLKDQNVPFFIGLPSHFPDRFAEAIRSCKPVQETQSTTVVYETHEIFPLIESELTFRVVEDKKQAEDWIDVFTDVFRGYGEIGQAFTDWAHHYKPNRTKSFLSVIGYKDEVPVTIGSISVKNGVVTVYNVGTRPSLQKNGYGALLMNCLVNWCGSQGYRYYGGEGSAAGMHLYRKLRIREVGTSRRFIWT